MKIKHLTLKPAAIASVIIVLGALAHSSAGAAGIPATNAPVASNSIPLSVFDNSLANGKDPFFPNSRRRAIDVTAKNGEKTSADPTNLILQGFSHSATRPMATINNHSFQPGEESEVVTTSGRIRIRCEEIKNNSVVISIGGTQRLELKMPDKY